MLVRWRVDHWKAGTLRTMITVSTIEEISFGQTSDTGWFACADALERPSSRIATTGPP